MAEDAKPMYFRPIDNDTALEMSQDGLCGDRTHMRNCLLINCHEPKRLALVVEEASYAIIHAGKPPAGSVTREAFIFQAPTQKSKDFHVHMLKELRARRVHYHTTVDHTGVLYPKPSTSGNQESVARAWRKNATFPAMIPDTSSASSASTNSRSGTSKPGKPERDLPVASTASSRAAAHDTVNRRKSSTAMPPTTMYSSPKSPECAGIAKKQPTFDPKVINEKQMTVEEREWDFLEDVEGDEGTDGGLEDDWELVDAEVSSMI